MSEFVFPKPAPPRKVSALTVQRSVLLLLDFCEQLKRHGMNATGEEVRTVAMALNHSPEIHPEPVAETVH